MSWPRHHAAVCAFQTGSNSASWLSFSCSRNRNRLLFPTTGLLGWLWAVDGKGRHPPRSCIPWWLLPGHCDANAHNFHGVLTLCSGVWFPPWGQCWCPVLHLTLRTNPETSEEAQGRAGHRFRLKQFNERQPHCAALFLWVSAPFKRAPIRREGGRGEGKKGE